MRRTRYAIRALTHLLEAGETAQALRYLSDWQQELDGQASPRPGRKTPRQPAKPSQIDTVMLQQKLWAYADARSLTLEQAAQSLGFSCYLALPLKTREPNGIRTSKHAAHLAQQLGKEILAQHSPRLTTAKPPRRRKAKGCRKHKPAAKAITLPAPRSGSFDEMVVELKAQREAAALAVEERRRDELQKQAQRADRRQRRGA